MKNTLNWALARLSEKSTWLAILAASGTLLGVNLAPDLSEEITKVGLAVTSLALVLVKEKPKA